MMVVRAITNNRIATICSRHHTGANDNNNCCFIGNNGDGCHCDISGDGYVIMVVNAFIKLVVMVVTITMTTITLLMAAIIIMINGEWIRIVNKLME